MSLSLPDRRLFAAGRIVPITMTFVQLMIVGVIVYFGVESSIFVRRDVAFVYILSSLPLAVSLRRYLAAVPLVRSLRRTSVFARMIDRPSCLIAHGGLASYSSIGSRALAVAALSAILLPLSNGPGASFLEHLVPWIARTVVAACLSTAAWLTLPVTATSSGSTSSSVRGAVLFGFLVAALVPSVYVAARCRHDVILIEELVSQSRFGEAQTKLRQVCRLAPSMVWKSRPLKEFSNEIDRRVRDLESQVAMLPRKSMTAENRLERCRLLAMLGQTEAALAELTPLFEAEVAAPAFDLAGTIHESTSRWEVAKNDHQRAIASWQGQPASRQRDVGLLGSVMRLAYCERKLGHYDMAESYYLEVLAHSPTAENHFLLAQFYEDMQQSSKAHAHARRAMALDPRRYQPEGKKLIDKLILGHFGCLQIFREESKANSATRSVDFGY